MMGLGKRLVFFGSGPCKVLLPAIWYLSLRTAFAVDDARRFLAVSETDKFAPIVVDDDVGAGDATNPNIMDDAARIIAVASVYLMYIWPFFSRLGIETRKKYGFLHGMLMLTSGMVYVQDIENKLVLLCVVAGLFALTLPLFITALLHSTAFPKNGTKEGLFGMFWAWTTLSRKPWWSCRSSWWGWCIQLVDFLLWLTVFAFTGKTTLSFGKMTLETVFTKPEEETWGGYKWKPLLLGLSIYPVLLYTYGTLVGRHTYFYMVVRRVAQKFVCCCPGLCPGLWRDEEIGADQDFPNFDLIEAAHVN